MLPLFIVEDVLDHRKRIEEIIRDYIIIKEMNIDITMVTADPHECIEYLEENPDIRGLYFLDVDLKADIDGLELGRRIRELDPNGRIVIVTAKGTMAFFTFMYKLEVLDYITKEAPDEVTSRIRTCVKIAYERYMQMHAMERKSLEIMVGSRRRSIPLGEVCFIETCSGDHRLALHTLSGRVEFRGYMKEIEFNNPSLVRIHRAYLANLDNAREFDLERRVLEMANGEFCHVAYRKMSVVKKELEHRQNINW